MVGNPKRWVGWIPAPTRGAGLVEFYPPLKGWVGSTPPKFSSRFAKNYGGGQPFRRILPFLPHQRAAGARVWLKVGVFVGGLPPSPPWLFLQADDGTRLQLVVSDAPSTSIPCIGLVGLGVGGLPPLSPWLSQPRAVGGGGAALLPLPQPRLKESA